MAKERRGSFAGILSRQLFNIGSEILLKAEQKIPDHFPGRGDYIVFINADSKRCH